MKRIKKLAIVLTVLVLFMSSFSINSFATSNHNDIKGNEVKTLNEFDMSEIANRIIRYDFYFFLYQGSVVPADVKESDLLSLHMYSYGEGYKYVGQFRNKTWFSETNFTISMYVGSKEFWNYAVNSPDFKLDNTLNIGKLLLHTVESFYPKYFTEARAALQNDAHSIGDALLLRNGVNKLSSDGLLALIPAFSADIKYLGFIPTTVSRSSAVVVGCNGDVLMEEIPESEFPDWIYNGVAPIVH